MKTKILLGSIGAILILIFALFSNIVSVQSTTSKSVNQSPLFSIRTEKAIDQDSTHSYTSDYLGKGKNTYFIGMINERLVSYQKSIERLSRMDDTALNHFISSIIYHLPEQDVYEKSDVQELIASINQIRKNPEIILYNGNSNYTIKESPTFCWFPGCSLLRIIGLIIETILELFLPPYPKNLVTDEYFLG